MKALSGFLALACVPAVLAANNAPLPKDNVTEFVAAKLDVTTLPSSIRPKPQKGKKTFSDYGYVAQQADDKQKLIEATPEGCKSTSGSWNKMIPQCTSAFEPRARLRTRTPLSEWFCSSSRMKTVF